MLYLFLLSSVGIKVNSINLILLYFDKVGNKHPPLAIFQKKNHVLFSKCSEKKLIKTYLYINILKLLQKLRHTYQLTTTPRLIYFDFHAIRVVAQVDGSNAMMCELFFRVHCITLFHAKNNNNEWADGRKCTAENCNAEFKGP